MSAPAAHDARPQAGYRLDQLASAFSRVQNHRDWKAPIRAVIQADDRPLVEAAVRWFTNTVPAFEAAPGPDGGLVVVAAGYRLGPAGDAADRGAA